MWFCFCAKFLVEDDLEVVCLLVSYPCLCCRIQGWWSRLLFLWYSFKVVLTKLSILKVLLNLTMPSPLLYSLSGIKRINSWCLFCRVVILLDEMVCITSEAISLCTWSLLALLMKFLLSIFFFWRGAIHGKNYSHCLNCLQCGSEILDLYVLIPSQGNSPLYRLKVILK